MGKLTFQNHLVNTLCEVKVVGAEDAMHYRGTWFVRDCLPTGPYSRTMSRALWWSSGGGRFLMNEVPL